MKLFICPDNDIVKNSYKNHGNFHAGDSGLDLFINEDIVVKPGETAKINLNIVILFIFNLVILKSLFK